VKWSDLDIERTQVDVVNNFWERDKDGAKDRAVEGQLNPVILVANPAWQAERQSIDATMLRAAAGLGIAGFDGW
jgi:hypothetical protein